MAIRQEYEETLEFLAKNLKEETIIIPLALSAKEWQCLFQEAPMPLRLKLHAAMVGQRRLLEKQQEQWEQAHPTP